MATKPDWTELLAEREALSERLRKAWAHLPIERQYYLLTSRIGIDELRKLVEQEERRS